MAHKITGSYHADTACGCVCASDASVHLCACRCAARAIVTLVTHGMPPSMRLPFTPAMLEEVHAERFRLACCVHTLPVWSTPRLACVGMLRAHLLETTKRLARTCGLPPLLPPAQSGSPDRAQLASCYTLLLSLLRTDIMAVLGAVLDGWPNGTSVATTAWYHDALVGGLSLCDVENILTAPRTPGPGDVLPSLLLLAHSAADTADTVDAMHGVGIEPADNVQPYWLNNHRRAAAPAPAPAPAPTVSARVARKLVFEPDGVRLPDVQMADMTTGVSMLQVTTVAVASPTRRAPTPPPVDSWSSAAFMLSETEASI